MQYVYRYNKKRAPGKQKAIPKSALQKKASKVQSRRAYLAIQHKNNELIKLIVAFGWTELRDLAIKTFNIEARYYTDRKSEYKLVKLNRSDTTYKERQKIRGIVTHVPGFVAAVSYNFNSKYLNERLVKAEQEYAIADTNYLKNTAAHDREQFKTALEILEILDLNLLGIT